MNKQSIGIISMQRIVNYGSFLQAYAFSKILSNYSVDISFIDYHVRRPKFINGKQKHEYYKLYFKNSILNALVKMKPLWLFLPKKTRDVIKVNYNYKKHFLPMIGVRKKNYDSNRDIIFIGSDEVFNCLQNNPNVGYSENLFGQGLGSKRVYSYAASFGNTTLPRLEEYKLKDDISKYLNSFKEISVRDANSFNVVEKLTGVKPSIHLDPVLLYDFSDDLVDVKQEEKYMLVYAYRNRISEIEAKNIRKYAKDASYKIISIGGYQSFSDEHVICNPFEVLSYINKAECVITDTFHGTIYSIIFGKKFASYIRKTNSNSYGNEEKMTYLLNIFNLSGHIIDSSSSIERILNYEVNFSDIKKIIERERNRTNEYLKEIIESDQ